MLNLQNVRTKKGDKKMSETPAATPTPNVPSPLPWWVSFSINSGIAALHLALRNPHYAATLQETMMELRQAIDATYGPESSQG